MDKLKFYFLLLFIFLNSCGPGKKDITGVWQDLPMAASGWSDTYQFFANGKYIFNYSTMDCEKRIIRHLGEYKFQSDTSILLITKTRTIIEGGKLVPAMGSCGTDFQLEDGIIKEIQLTNPEKTQLSISSIVPDKENLDKDKIVVNGVSFWRFSKDAAAY